MNSRKNKEIILYSREKDQQKLFLFSTSWIKSKSPKNIYNTIPFI